MINFDKNFRMNTFEQSIHQEITKKLKDAPKDILEKVLSYVNNVLDKNSPATEHHLTSIVREDYSNYKTGKTELLDINDVEKELDQLFSNDEN